MTVTPDFEAELIARLLELAPDAFAAPSIFPGQEQPAGGDVPLEATFVRWYGERRLLLYGGQVREISIQILSRFARDGWTPPRRQEAMDRLRAVYDAIHLSGAWVSTSGARYLDIRAGDAPGEVSPAYFALNVVVFYSG
jgi:hypothetical protein